VRSAADLTLDERGDPVPKIEVKRKDAPPPHKTLIGLHQQVLPVKLACWNKAARDQNVVVS
jgi:hypothetical protein